jgi:hypothetical protein
MLTLFSVPQAWEGHRAVIQSNALESWRRLSPAPLIVLLCDDPGTQIAAAQAGAGYIPNVARNEYGTPLVSDVFAQGEAYAQTNIVCYINADIILLPGFMEAVAACASLGRPFLMIGQRTDLDVTQHLGFAPGWGGRLKREAKRHGVLHKVTGIDYFVYRPGTMGAIPEFALGRWRWDNWLVWNALARGLMVVDATQAITAIHQNHDYAHHVAADQQLVANNALVAQTKGKLKLISDATHILTADRRITVKNAAGV